jgi:hypothetical protein
VLTLAGWLGPLDAEVRDDIEAAALFGYLCVRVHDDLIDDGEGEPGDALLLAHRLFLEHHGLLVRHVADHRYWLLHHERWDAYVTAMAEERELGRGDRTWDDDAFARVLDRSRPLVLPGAAVLALQGRWDAVRDLRDLVDALVTAHQRFDDLVDVTADRAAGRATRATVAFNLSFVDAELDRAGAELDRAESAARALGADPAIPWIQGRRARMEAWRHALMVRVLGFLVD